MDAYYVDLARDSLHKAVNNLQHAQNYIARAQLGAAHDYSKEAQRVINSIRRLTDNLGLLVVNEEINK